MSGVRVLVGTRKGAFVLTSDGKREKWEVSGPHFAGWEIYHLKGSPADPNRIYASQIERLVRAGDPALRRRRQDLGAGRQRVRLRRRARHAPVVRRHAASRGSSSASGTSSRRSTDPDTVYAGVEDAALFRIDRRRQDAGRSCPACATTARAALAARRRRHVPAHDPPRPDEPGPDLHRHLGRRRVPHRRRRRDLAADQPRPAVRGHSRSRTPRSATACTASRMHPSRPERAVHAEALGRDAQRRRRRQLARGQRQPADRLRLPDRRARARAGDDLRRADQERLASTSRPTASCASTAAAPAATSGRR